MKLTTFIATLLTLLALLLVAGAAVLFLLQERQDYEREAQIQQSELDSHIQTVNDLQSTAAARQITLSTSEAQVVSQNAQMATQGAQVATLDAQVATRDAELATALAATAEPTATPAAQPSSGSGPPRLEIVHPLFGASVTADSILPIIVIGSANEGITRMELAVGDRPPMEEEYEEGTTYAIFRRTVFNLTPGSLVITATITTADQESDSTSVRIFVRDVEAEGESGTQGLRTALVAARPN